MFKENKIQETISYFYDKFPLHIVNFSREIIAKASDLRNRYQLHFWDGIIIASALSVNCKIVYSEDMHDGLVVEEKLRIVNPFKKQQA